MAQFVSILVCSVCLYAIAAGADGKVGSAPAGAPVAKQSDASPDPLFLSEARLQRMASELRRKNDLIFSNASSEKLAQLKKNRSLDLALRAAWQEALRASPRSQESREGMVNPAFARFVGFVDGRLPVDLPEWWALSVASGRSDNAHSQSFHCSGMDVPWSNFGNGQASPKERIWTLKGIAAHFTDQRIQMDTGNMSVEIPARIVSRLSFANIVSSVFDKDAIYVIVASINPHPCPLVKIDRATKKVLWEAQVWADGANVAGITIDGVPGHFVESRIGRDGQIYVFGNCIYSVYLESFCSTDGSCRFRFSTVY